MPSALFSLPLACLALALALATPALAQSPANTLNELFASLRRCWEPRAESVGYEATLRFSLRRDGSVIGKPAITYSKLGQDEALNRAFIASVLGGLEACTPVALTPGMGGAIAGRILTIRHRHTAQGPETFVLLAPMHPTTLHASRRHAPNRALRVAQRNLLGKQYGRVR